MNITELINNPSFKKVMTYVRVAAAVFLVAGALFKVFHIDGANALILVGLILEVLNFIVRGIRTFKGE